MANDITILTIEEIVKKRQQAVQAQDEIEAARKILDEEIMRRMDEKRVQGIVVEDVAIKKVGGVRFTTKVDIARDLGATKTEEKIDTKKLRQLYEAGVEVDGANPFSYIRVKQMEV